GVPIYVAGTGPRMQQYAGEEADGLLTPSITTPGFVRYARENMSEGAREIAGMYLANKVQNIQSSADVLLEEAGLSQDEIRPIAEAMESGGRLAAARAVSDSILDKTRPIAGTPSDCIEAIEEYRDSGCTHIMLELWGEQRDHQIELFAEKVLPRFKT
ncbi:MAG: LLM class flavin-dependent oxidoreductase, partial [Solirubrobacterales bacterium]|nr:LLM class flavin-dependent oxidoreductase [Solirubrobacterales bacterium]